MGNISIERIQGRRPAQSVVRPAQHHIKIRRGVSQMYVPPGILAARQLKIYPPPFARGLFYGIIRVMKRTIWFWVCFVAAIVLATYFATRIIMISLGHGKLAVVQTISITTDAGNKDLTGLAAAVGVAPGTHTYSADLDAINARIGAVPGVKKSAVRRMPNGNLSVRVNLYRAVALWTDDGQTYYPLSADGTIVNRPGTERDDGAIVFRGPVPDDITSITKVAHNIANTVDYLQWIENRRWNLHTRGGIVVLLPEDDPVAAISTLMVLDKNHAILSRDLKTIDMRDSARILVK